MSTGNVVGHVICGSLMTGCAHHVGAALVRVVLRGYPVDGEVLHSRVGRQEQRRRREHHRQAVRLSLQHKLSRRSQRFLEKVWHQSKGENTRTTAPAAAAATVLLLE
jgi:hypothetical protein